MCVDNILRLLVLEAHMSILSLWQIDADLEQLIEVRAEILRDREDIAGLSEEHELSDTTAVDEQIKLYLTEHLPRKADAIAAQLRKWRAEVDSARKEEERCYGVRRRAEARSEHLKANVIAIMQHCPAVAVSKTGSLSLAGTTSILRVQGNGGMAELQIYDERLIPDEYRVAVVKLSRSAWLRLLDSVESGNRSNLVYQSVTYEIDEDAIRAELAKRCESCAGSGKRVTVKIENYITEANDYNCPDCGATGRHLVPGARLMPRGVHLRVVDR